MKHPILAALLLTLYGGSAQAQHNILEKDYEISRKAKKGYLGSVAQTDNGGFDMIYVLPSGSRKIKTEIYHFDKDANLLNTDKEEMEVEKARKKWRWFTYRGDYFITNTLSAGANMTGTLLFRKKRVTANWNWWTGRYDRNVKMTDKVKPKNESGRKYRFVGGAYEVERDSSVLVLALDPTDDAKYGNPAQYALLKCDNEVNIQKLQTLDFPFAVQPVFSKALTDEYVERVPNDDAPRDWIIVMAPSKTLSTKSNRADNPASFFYVRISPEGTVKEKIAFTAPSTGFRILNAYEKDGAVLLYGLGTGDKGKFIDQELDAQLVPTTSADADEQAAGNTDQGKMFGGVTKTVNMFSGQDDLGVTQEAVDTKLDEKNYKQFVFVKIQNGATSWSTINDMDAVNDNAVAPPDMKRPLKFDGKKFYVSNLQYLNNGQMVMSIQDFKIKKENRYYQGMFLMHFDDKGKLLKNYTVKLDQRGKKGFFNNSPMTSDMFPASSFVYETPAGSINWVMHIVKGIDKDTYYDNNYFAGTTTKTTTWTPLYSVEYGSINPEAGSASDFKTLGEDEKRKYYLYESNNTLRIDNFLYFFSETTRGDKLLVSRMEL